MGRAARLPAVEVLELEEGPRESAAERTVQIGARRPWWPIGAVLVVLAGVVVVAGHGRGTKADAAAPTTTPTTVLAAPVDAEPGARGVRVRGSAVLPSSDGSSVLIVFGGRGLLAPVSTPDLPITSVFARQRFTVTFTRDGHVKAFARDQPGGIDLGFSRGVFPAADPLRVWLAEDGLSGPSVREVPVDGSHPPSLALGLIGLPTGWHPVAGIEAGLVLSDAPDAATPGRLVVWDPHADLSTEVSPSGHLLAADADSVAWTADCCGPVVRRFRDQPSVIFLPPLPGLDPGVQGAFSPDGRYLALPIIGARPGAGAGAVVHAVTVIDLDADTATARQTPEIRSTSPLAVTWTDGDVLVARDASDRLYRYLPGAGLLGAAQPPLPQ